MLHKCGLCSAKVLVFIWSSSKVIDKEKFRELAAKKNINDRSGVPICWACIGEHHLIEGTKNER